MGGPGFRKLPLLIVTKKLLINFSPESEFECSTGGQCVTEQQRCNGKNECRDASDEVITIIVVTIIIVVIVEQMLSSSLS